MIFALKSKSSAAPKPWIIERLVSLTADDHVAHLSSQLSAFASILLIHLASRDMVRYLEGQPSWRLWLALGFGLCFAASFFPAYRRFAYYGATAIATLKLVAVFPLNSNHSMVELVCILLIAMAYRPDGANLAVLSQSLRWLPILVFFFSGLQKMMMGTYFDGSFLAFSAASDTDFRAAFQWMLPEAEFARLQAIKPPGPYLFELMYPVVLSNLVYIGEIVVAGLLLMKRTRLVGLIGSMVMIVGIELVAKELFFGVLFANLVLLYAPRDWSKPALPWCCALYAVLLAVTAGLLPEFKFN
jgi:hypothetical protein